MDGNFVRVRKRDVVEVPCENTSFIARLIVPLLVIIFNKLVGFLMGPVSHRASKKSFSDYAVIFWPHPSFPRELKYLT